MSWIEKTRDNDGRVAWTKMHIMKGDFQLYDCVTSIDMIDIFKKIENENIQPEFIRVDDIHYKDISNIDTNSTRYLEADTSYPVVLIKDLSSYNKDNKKYRMIDGRHRLLKLLSNPATDSVITAYVIPFSNIEPLINIHRTCIKCDHWIQNFKITCDACNHPQFLKKNIKTV